MRSCDRLILLAAESDDLDTRAELMQGKDKDTTTRAVVALGVKKGLSSRSLFLASEDGIIIVMAALSRYGNAGMTIQCL
jgi:hypothetical protein